MKQKVAVIGGSSGMGLAIAKQAVSDGFEVVIASRNIEKLNMALSQIDGRYASAEPVNITDESSIESLFRKIGNFDHLVITGSEVIFGDFQTMSIEDMQSSFNSKLFGAIKAIRIARKYISESGSITLFSGSASTRPEKGTEIISALNAAIDGLSRSLAVNLVPIRVNTISPGLIDTPVYNAMTSDDKKKFFKDFTKDLPIPNEGHVDDVAKAALYLIKTRYATGSIVSVDGGHALR